MKRLAVWIAFAASCILTLGGTSEPTTTAQREFVGAASCKFCHARAESGDQYGQWMQSGHARAFATLAGEESARIVKSMGLSGDAQQLDECLRCHVTGHGADAALLGKKYSVDEGVGCESCHGAGGDYKRKKVMEDKDACAAAGLQSVREATCLGCHNPESPTYQGFDYAAMLAKVQHPNPQRAGSSR